MTQKPTDELLSAYLDGEVTPEERAQVERLLAESAEYRQLYEELQGVRNSLMRLPRYPLPADLSTRVLERAGGETSREGAKDHSAPAHDAVAGQIVPSQPWPAGSTQADSLPGHHRLSWRAIVWPILVSAAALLLMISNRETPKREVARAERSSSDKAAKVLTGPSSMGPVPGESVSDYDDQSFAYDEATFDELDQKGGLQDGSSAVTIQSGNVQTEALASKSALQSDLARRGVKADASTRAGSKWNHQGVQQKDNLNFELLTRDDAATAATPAPNTLVLVCEMTPEAAEAGAFEALLARNQLVEQPAEAVAGETLQRSRYYQDNKVLKKLEDSDQPDSVEPNDSPAQRQSNLKERISAEVRDADEMSEPLEAESRSVAVDLTPRQLASVLVDLEQHPDEFVEVQLSGPTSSRGLREQPNSSDRRLRFGRSRGGMGGGSGPARGAAAKGRGNRTSGDAPRAKASNSAREIAAEGTALPAAPPPRAHSKPTSGGQSKSIEQPLPATKSKSAEDAEDLVERYSAPAAGPLPVPTAEEDEILDAQENPRLRVIFELRVAGEPVPEQTEAGEAASSSSGD